MPLVFYPTRTPRKTTIRQIVLHTSLAAVCTAIPTTGFCIRLADDLSRTRETAGPLLSTGTLIWLGCAVGVLLLALAYLIYMGTKLSFKLRDEVHIWTYYKDTVSLITTFMAVTHPLAHIIKMRELLQLQNNSLLTLETRHVLVGVLNDVADVCGIRIHPVERVLALRDMKDCTLVVTDKFEKKLPKSTEGYDKLYALLQERMVEESV